LISGTGATSSSLKVAISLFSSPFTLNSCETDNPKHQIFLLDKA